MASIIFRKPYYSQIKKFIQAVIQGKLILMYRTTRELRREDLKSAKQHGDSTVQDMEDC